MKKCFDGNNLDIEANRSRVNDDIIDDTASKVRLVFNPMGTKYKRIGILKIKYGHILRQEVK